MSRADKSTPAVRFIKGIECAHSLGFHIVIYETDAGHLAVSLRRNSHQFSNEGKSMQGGIIQARFVWVRVFCR